MQKHSQSPPESQAQESLTQESKYGPGSTFNTHSNILFSRITASYVAVLVMYGFMPKKMDRKEQGTQSGNQGGFSVCVFATKDTDL